MTNQATETAHLPHEDGPRIAVLLVDDQRLVGVAVSRLLATEPDIDLHCCLTAVDAISRANQIGPAVILQDLVMPEIDGLTMVRRFRENPSTADTSIIVLSGNDGADVRASARSAGANDYLVKLPSKADLVACIRRHATGAGADPAEGSAASGCATAPAAHEAHETLDPRVMAEFRQASPGAPGFLSMLIDGFISEAESQVQTLGDARQRLDTGALTAIAHSLKGSSMTMGARRLAALCAEVEAHAVHDPGSPAAVDLLTAIDREFGNVRDALKVERDGNCL